MRLSPDELPSHFNRSRKVTFWGHETTEGCAFCSLVHGDGQQLLSVTPLNTRPSYYVIRVDSRFCTDGDDIGDVLDLLADEFGDHCERADDCEPGEGERIEEHNGQRFLYRPFPALDLGSGVTWEPIDWPEA